MGTVANLIVRIGVDAAALDKAFTGLESKAAAVQKKYEQLGASLQGVGAKMTAGITLPIVGFGAAAAKAFVDFESAMKGVEAALVPSGVELKALEAAALEWGAKTKFSATEAATALGELGKSGFDTGQSIGALPSVLQLATVSGMQLGDAATLTADTLKQFNLGVSEAARVNDVLTKAAQLSTVDVAQLGESLKYAGPVAAGLGLSFEQTNAALAAFGNVGIKADMAGTALRNVLGDIVNPTKALSDVLGKLGIDTLVSSDGTIKFAEVIDRLKAAGASAGDVLKAFGDRAGPGMVALVAQGSAGIRDLDVALKGAGGSAERAATVQMSGLGGALEQMRGAVETAGIAVGKILAPALTSAADAVGRLAGFITTTIVPAFAALPKPVQVFVGAILAIAAAAGPVIYVAGTLISAWGAVAGAFAAGSSAAGVLSGAIAVITGPIGLTVAAVAGLVLGLRWLVGSWENVLRVLTLGILDFGRVSAVWELLKAGASALVAGLQMIGAYVGGVLLSAWEGFRGVLEAVAESGFGRLVRAVAAFIATAAGWAVITVAVVQWEALKGALWLVGEAFGFVWRLVQPIAAWFAGVLGQAIGLVWDQFARLATLLGGAVVDAFRFVVVWLDKLAGKAADVLNWLSRTIPGFDKVAGTAKAAGAAVATFGGHVFAAGTQAATAAVVVGTLAAGVATVKPAAAAAVPPLAKLGTTAAATGTAAADAAKKIKDLAYALSGAGKIADAEEYLKALKALPAGARLTVDAMARVHGALEEALDVYKALGRTAPVEMQKVWAATIAAPDIERSILKALDGVDWNKVRNDIAGRTINVGIVGLAPGVTQPAPLGLTTQLTPELERAAEQVAEWSDNARETVSNAFAGAITGVHTWSDAVRDVFGQLQGWVTNLISGITQQLVGGLMKGTGGFVKSLKDVGAQMKALGSQSKLVKYGGGAAVGGVIGYSVGSRVRHGERDRRRRGERRARGCRIRRRGRRGRRRGRGRDRGLVRRPQEEQRKQKADGGRPRGARQAVRRHGEAPHRGHAVRRRYRQGVRHEKAARVRQDRGRVREKARGRRKGHREDRERPRARERVGRAGRHNAHAIARQSAARLERRSVRVHRGAGANRDRRADDLSREGDDQNRRRRDGDRRLDRGTVPRSSNARASRPPKRSGN